MIRINETWLINSDDHCWTIYKDKHVSYADKRGRMKPHYVATAYYGTLNKALNAILELNRREVAQTLDCDLKTALETLTKADKGILRAIEAAFPDKKIQVS